MSTKAIGTYCCALGIALSMSVDGAQPVLVDETAVAQGKINFRPDYPAEAQAQRLTGNGVFVLHVDPTNGRVRSVQVEKSTGHKILDEASIDAFTNLRFKAHTVLRVIIPVTFTLAPEAIRRTHGYPATVLFQNERPLMMTSRGGRGK